MKPFDDAAWIELRRVDLIGIRPWGT